MKIKIVNNSQHDSPQYATVQSAGLDLRANLEEPIILKPLVLQPIMKIIRLIFQ